MNYHECIVFFKDWLKCFSIFCTDDYKYLEFKLCCLTGSGQPASVVLLNFPSYRDWVKKSGAKTCSIWAWKFTSTQFWVLSPETFLLVWLFIACEFKRGINVPVAHKLRRWKDGFGVGSPPFLAQVSAALQSCTSPWWSMSGLWERWWSGSLLRSFQWASPGEICINAVWPESTQPLLAEEKMVSSKCCLVQKCCADWPFSLEWCLYQALPCPRGYYQFVPSAVSLLAWLV